MSGKVLIPIEERFWSKVNKNGPVIVADLGPCWTWTAALRHKGYGQFSRPGTAPAKAHRMAWELVNGPIPHGLSVLHRCDNPPCVNPAHLFIGTVQDNNADMMAKHRYARGIRVGSAGLTEDNVASIRRLYADGMTQETIARLYWISGSNVSLICTRSRWAHVA